MHGCYVSYVHATVALRGFGSFKTISISTWALLFSCVAVHLVGCASGAQQSRTEVAREINDKKNQADALMRSGDYQGAVELLTPLSQQKKVRDSQLFSMLAEAQWKLGAYAEATQSYEASLRLDYSNSEVHLAFAEMLMETGKIGRAMTEFELAIQFGQRDPLAHYNYGLALFRMDRVEQALAQWQIAYERDPTKSEYAAALGMGYSRRDDAKALEYFERAERLGAAAAPFHDNFGLLLTRIGQYQRAERELRAAQTLDPDNVDYQRNVATLYMKMKEYGEAIPLLQALQAASPDDRTYRIYLARSYMEEGRYDESIALLEGWVEAQDEQSGGTRRSPGATPAPGLDEAYGVLAMSYRGVDNLGKAAENMDAALAIARDNVVHLINYGVILAEDGKIAEARVQWEKVLRLDPDNAVAKQNLSATQR